MNSRLAILLTLIASLSGCQIYKTQFECPPGEGVPCASVSEIESMIIETPCGPDLFVGKKSEEPPSHKKKKQSEEKAKGRFIWVAETVNCNGEICEGHYVLLPDYPKGCR